MIRAYSLAFPRRLWRWLCLLILPLLVCSKQEVLSDQAKREGTGPSATLLSPDEPPSASEKVSLPLKLERHTGDLDEMIKRRTIRALVMMNPVGFFYDQGEPRGVIYEGMQEFQKFLNQKLKTGKIQVLITFLPVTPEQIEAALTEGLGDFIANAVVITPERQKRVAFSTPILSDVTQIIVSGPKFGTISKPDDLAGKAIYANPLFTYYENLQKLSNSLQNSGKRPIEIKAADKNLNDDDLIQMVHAGLIPATVTITPRAELWSKVFDDIKPHPELVIASKVQLAMVMRKNNPQFKQLLDEFVSTHNAGTSFGNTLLRRYLQNLKWVKDAISNDESKKFQALIQLFQKYAGEYDFDYLMLAAQGYQESMLNQNSRSPDGSVGIMQVKPKLAAAPPISIPNVGNADANIHAGAKMLRNIADTYFSDPQLDPLNRTLLTFASYNAGPNRILRLREKATEMGLNPNVWFGNVELVVAKEIGQVTVMYVGNIYKYYVAYKMAFEQSQFRDGNSK